MPRLVARLPLLLFPLLLFGAFFDWHILDITRIGWLLQGSDNGENALGLHAFLHDPSPGFLRTGLLGAPEGVGLLFTDSNPLLGLIAFPLREWLPADTQLLGWWLLACLFLQVFFAWLLLRRHAPGPVALWCGVLLLAALPSLFARTVHVNLMAHWLILWALWRFTDPVSARSNAGWAVLIALTAFVHSYLLVMVGAIWASAMLERSWHTRADLLGLARLAAECAGILALVGAIAWSLGVLEPHRPSGNYGAFAMPIDAMWNPAVDGFSAFLPAIAQRPGRDMEGFQYLGLGLLLLLAAAAILAPRLPRGQAPAQSLARLKWLLPALVVLTMLAISPYPDFAGRALPRYHLSADLLAALDAVRASGRLFWPVAYTMVFAALRIVYRLSPDRAALALALLAAVQIVDLAPMSAAIRAQTASHAVAPTAPAGPSSARWSQLIARARDIAFVPADVTRDLTTFQAVAWQAVKAGKPVRSVYAARPTLETLARQDAETAAFRAGKAERGRLYVLIANEPVPGPLMTHATPLDGVTVILLP